MMITKRRTKAVRLNDVIVKKAKAAKAARLLWDSLQRGLALRVQPSGHKAWCAIYSRAGRPRWLHLGAADIVPLADARVMAAEALLAVAKGKDPAAEKQAERGKGTFSELAAKYVEQHSKKNNKSWAQADKLVRRYALPRVGKMQAAAVSRGDIKTLMARIEAPIVANQTWPPSVRSSHGRSRKRSSRRTRAS
jgi:hypothetical protein